MFYLNKLKTGAFKVSVCFVTNVLVEANHTIKIDFMEHNIEAIQVHV